MMMTRKMLAEVMRCRANVVFKVSYVIKRAGHCTAQLALHAFCSAEDRPLAKPRLEHALEEPCVGTALMLDIAGNEEEGLLTLALALGAYGLGH